jgi:hypothetical protein
MVMPRDFTLGHPADVFMPIAIAGIVVFIGFVIAVLSYIRAVDAVVSFIREKKLNLIQQGKSVTWDRDLYILPGAMHPRYLIFWISRVVLGTKSLNIADADYRALLRAARMRLLACLILFVIFLIGLGWVTQGTMR